LVPLKRHLLLLVLGALLPLLALAVALTLLLVREDREQTEHALHENARLLSEALDAELGRSITALKALSRNEALRSGDLRAFYDEAKDLRDSLGLWDNVLLLSPQGEHLINLMRPYGEKLPALPQPEGPIEAARTRSTYISNALQGRLDTDWLMFMNYPVVIRGEVRYVLGVTMNYRYWSRWLSERAPEGFVASIVDRDYAILARTRDAERLAGQPVQPWFRDLMASREGGTVRGRGLLDPDVVVAFHRSGVSGWHINLFTPGSVVDAPGRRTAFALAIGVALTLAIAVALALWRAAVLSRDITSVIRALQGDLRAQNRELAEADRRKDEFLATLAHELRNPLAPIRTAADLLKRADLPPEAGRTARDIIERQAQHMTRMVDDLLEAGRITRGALQLHPEKVELAAAARWALEAVQPAFDQAGVALAVHVPDEPLWLEADPTRLVQILVNLLGNAAKYTPRGGHAWLEARRDGDWIEVRVRDDGIGIERQALPGLFRMFAHTRPALERPQGGLGIGLALVRGLVERHGGTIEAHSEGAGRGAEFVVRLPASAAPETAAPGQREAAAAPAPGRRILVADDNRDGADTLAAILRSMGYEVLVAYDGEEALRGAAQFRPDAMVLDIGMPRGNGYEVAAQAREADWGRDILLVALTGWGQERDKARAREAGFHHHLTKPVDTAALVALLSKQSPQNSGSVS
jgi:signal transduction histidine kinase/ActR/RegA family two-component response regulator